MKKPIITLSIIFVSLSLATFLDTFGGQKQKKEEITIEINLEEQKIKETYVHSADGTLLIHEKGKISKDKLPKNANLLMVFEGAEYYMVN